MELIVIFCLIIFIAIPVIGFAPVLWKGQILLFAILASSIISTVLAVQVLLKDPIHLIFAGSLVTGPVPVIIDALSAWFILMINFTFATGAFYGIKYMRGYQNQTANTAMHWIAYLLAFAGLMAICVVQNSIVFLVVWEVMALSSFMLIIFEHHKQLTIKAGINFLIQSHVSILFITIAFIFVAIKMKSYDFSAIKEFTLVAPEVFGIILFCFFFIGFGIKAGFVPFHTWLPYAHPAAPAHISAIMSGVIIKIGIYGILRILSLIKTDFITIGIIVLLVSVVSGVYGVLLAIVQHNLKKLLAYHSIENIGIIGIGIGLGTLGVGLNNTLLIVSGFSGALLHTLNHSLFKSLLFYAAGNIYQFAHTMNIEKLGGLNKKIPATMIAFLIGSLAITGLPLFNGFVSEFLLYNGLISSLRLVNFPYFFIIIFAIFGLVMIGGMALLCFSKAVSIIFLGSHRGEDLPEERPKKLSIVPLYVIVIFLILIGMMPRLFFMSVLGAVNVLTGPLTVNDLKIIERIISQMGKMGYATVLFAGLIGAGFVLRKKLLGRKTIASGTTWGCGYTAPVNNMQYSANSFVRGFRKIVGPLLSIKTRKKELNSIFPKMDGHYSTHSKDLIEIWIIDHPILFVRKVLKWFRFLQNGNLQFYILYGVIFITMILAIPMIFDKLIMSIKLFYHL